MNGRPADSLDAETPLEISVELQLASNELMRIGTSHIVNNRRAAGHAAVTDSITLDGLVSRLHDGTMTPAMARLFLVAARRVIALHAEGNTR